MPGAQLVRRGQHAWGVPAARLVQGTAFCWSQAEAWSTKQLSVGLLFKWGWGLGRGLVVGEGERGIGGGRGGGGGQGKGDGLSQAAPALAEVLLAGGELLVSADA